MKNWQKIRKAYKNKDIEEFTLALVNMPFLELKGKYLKIRQWWNKSYDMLYGLGIDTGLSYLFIPLPSKEKGYITYFRSFENLMKETPDGEGLRTKTTIGRFLRRHTDMTDDEIKRISEVFHAKYGQNKLYFINNTDPDGWESVYEAGYGFSSCMVYNRDCRYLDDRCYGEHHPARVYAHPENDLALAYMANREWDGNKGWFRVYSRSIVNLKEKTYLRVYGDDSIKSILEEEGFHYSNETTDKQKLKKIEIDDGLIVCPYLDGNMNRVEDMGTYLITSHNGFETRSIGLVLGEWICPHCGRSHDDQDDAEIFIEEHDDTRCTECVNEDYVWGYVRRNFEGYIRREDAIEINSDYYTEESAQWHDFVYSEEEDAWIHVDDCVHTSRGFMRHDNPNVVQLSIDDSEGNSYAHCDDVITAWDVDGNEHVIHEDTDLEENGLFDFNPIEA